MSDTTIGISSTANTGFTVAHTRSQSRTVAHSHSYSRAQPGAVASSFISLGTWQFEVPLQVKIPTFLFSVAKSFGSKSNILKELTIFYKLAAGIYACIEIDNNISNTLKFDIRKFNNINKKSFHFIKLLLGPFLSSLFTHGWDCGTGVFELIGCQSLYPGFALPTFVNNNSKQIASKQECSTLSISFIIIDFKITVIRYGIPNTDYSIAHRQYHIPNTNYGISHHQYHIPNTNYGISHHQYHIPNTNYSISHHQYGIPNTNYSISHHHSRTPTSPHTSLISTTQSPLTLSPKTAHHQHPITQVAPVVQWQQLANNLLPGYNCEWRRAMKGAFGDQHCIT